MTRVGFEPTPLSRPEPYSGALDLTFISHDHEMTFRKVLPLGHLAYTSKVPIRALFPIIIIIRVKMEQ